MTPSSDKYDEFVAGYEKLCRETNYCFGITNGGELSLFWVSAMGEDFEKQIREFKGGEEEDD